MTHRENAKIFKAFGDETRLAILAMLRGGECCACVLLEAVRVGQSTLSHHMKILVESGVVSARREGKWTYYALCAEGRARVLELLASITQPRDPTEKLGHHRTSRARCQRGSFRGLLRRSSVSVAAGYASLRLLVGHENLSR